MYDPEYYAGLYTNVLVDLDSFQQKHHHGHHPKGGKDVYDLDPTTVSPYDGDEVHQTMSNQERQDWFDEAKNHQNQKIYSQMKSKKLHPKGRKDVYDYDPTTVSPYDGDEVHQTMTNKERQDWFDEAKKHQNQKIYSFHQKHKKDAYDNDSNTASPYDAGNNINGGNPVNREVKFTDQDTAIGPPEPALIDAIKKGYWWDKELEKEMKMPPGPGQADARKGFAGAIPTTKGGELYCEGVGATCDADKTAAADAKEKKAADAEEKDPAKEEGKKIAAEEQAKAEKKEKGEGPKEETPEETPAAFSQVHHGHHHHHKRH